MLKIELYEYGFENVISEIKFDLDSALRSKSKKKKDELITKSLGAIESLDKLVLVREFDDGEEECEEE